MNFITLPEAELKSPYVKRTKTVVAMSSIAYIDDMVMITSFGQHINLDEGEAEMVTRHLEANASVLPVWSRPLTVGLQLYWTTYRGWRNPPPDDRVGQTPVTHMGTIINFDSKIILLWETTNFDRPQLHCLTYEQFATLDTRTEL